MLANSPAAQAVALFHDHYNCAQAILMAFGPAHGLDVETAQKLGRPLGSGMGGKGMTCGAITAAILILGLAQPERSERQAKKEVYRATRELVDRFEARYGSALCKDLLGADLNTRQGRAKAKLQGITRTACPGFVLAIAGILEGMLTEQT